jgi:predicted transcriptional regulator
MGAETHGDRTMKCLQISFKTSKEVLDGFKRAYHKAKIRKTTTPHYEISFDTRRDFELFTRNIYILSNILAYKPRSVYELAKISGMDASNLNKIILFFEKVGAVKIKERTISGRAVRTPIVDYDRIEFKLAA